MNSRATSRFLAYGCPEFVIYHDEKIPDPWLDWLIDFLDSTAGDTLYSAGETLQIGWMICRIAQNQEYLTLQEPDFSGMPLQWENSVSRTLRHLFLQRFVAESVALENELHHPTISQTAILCSRFTSNNSSFQMDRCEPSADNPRDSGWFLGCLDPNHDHNTPENLKLESLYEATISNDAIVPYLALPTGISLVQSRKFSSFSIKHNQVELAVIPNSYLDKQRN